MSLFDAVTTKTNTLIGTSVPLAAGVVKMAGIVDEHGALITFAIAAAVGITSLVINLMRIATDYRKWRDARKPPTTHV